MQKGESSSHIPSVDTASGKLAALEAEHARLKAEYRSVVDDRLQFLRDLAQREPELVHKLFAAAALKLPLKLVDEGFADVEANPLSFLVEDRSQYYKDIAALCCIKHGMLARESADEDLYPLREFVTDEFAPYFNGFRRDSFAQIGKVERDVFGPHESAFGYAIGRVFELIHCGVPLVRDTGGQYSEVIEPDPLYLYLGMSWVHAPCPDITHWPNWVAGHSFRKTHISALRVWFEGGTHDLTPEQIAARRRAFREAIGLPATGSQSDSAITSSGEQTQLLRHAAAVRGRYYGRAFVLADPDTWPKQADIVTWLRSTYSLSKRLAEAVELVACPDEVRQRR